MYLKTKKLRIVWSRLFYALVKRYVFLKIKILKDLDLFNSQSSASLESNLEGLASVLEADLPSFKNKILRILTDCAIKMPEKCTIYTTLVGLLNVKNYNFGGEVTNFFSDRPTLP